MNPQITVDDDGTTPIEQLPVSITQLVPYFSGSLIALRDYIASMQKKMTDIDKDAAIKKAPIQAEIEKAIAFEKSSVNELNKLPPR